MMVKGIWFVMLVALQHCACSIGKTIKKISAGAISSYSEWSTDLTVNSFHWDYFQRRLAQIISGQKTDTTEELGENMYLFVTWTFTMSEHICWNICNMLYDLLFLIQVQGCTLLRALETHNYEHLKKTTVVRLIMWSDESSQKKWLTGIKRQISFMFNLSFFMSNEVLITETHLDPKTVQIPGIQFKCTKPALNLL